MSSKAQLTREPIGNCPLCNAIKKAYVWGLFEEHEDEGIDEIKSLFETEELAEIHWKELDESPKLKNRHFFIQQIVLWGEE